MAIQNHIWDSNLDYPSYIASALAKHGYQVESTSVQNTFSFEYTRLVLRKGDKLVAVTIESYGVFISIQTNGMAFFLHTKETDEAEAIKIAHYKIDKVIQDIILNKEDNYINTEHETLVNKVAYACLPILGNDYNIHRVVNYKEVYQVHLGDTTLNKALIIQVDNHDTSKEHSIRIFYTVQDYTTDRLEVSLSNDTEYIISECTKFASQIAGK